MKEPRTAHSGRGSDGLGFLQNAATANRGNNRHGNGDIKSLRRDGNGSSRLGKLIRLLASDKSGEVIAAASAINRALRSAGLDISVGGSRRAQPTHPGTDAATTRWRRQRLASHARILPRAPLDAAQPRARVCNQPSVLALPDPEATRLANGDL
jgi:hypothetical protein